MGFSQHKAHEAHLTTCCDSVSSPQGQFMLWWRGFATARCTRRFDLVGRFHLQRQKRHSFCCFLNPYQCCLSLLRGQGRWRCHFPRSPAFARASDALGPLACSRHLQSPSPTDRTSTSQHQKPALWTTLCSYLSFFSPLLSFSLQLSSSSSREGGDCRGR